MSNKNEPGMAYDINKLNKIFAFLSVLFLMTVIWVFLDDFIRPWKAYQLEAEQVRRQKIAKDLKKENLKIDKKNLSKLSEDLAAANLALEGKSGESESIEKELSVLHKEMAGERIINGQLNGKVSATAFSYGVAHSSHSTNAHHLFEKLQSYKALFASSKDLMKQQASSEKKLKNKIMALRKDVADLENSIKKIVGSRDLLKMAHEKTDITPITVVRNAPFLDFLDPSLKIRQIVLQNITDDRYFQHVPKVDRCTTCHTLIDKAGFENQPNPHKTHPNLSLILGEKSAHPMKKIGCTTCHGGEGHRVTDFTSIAHTPVDETQKEQWIKKYSWKPPHHIPARMFKKHNTEAGCVKCHTDKFLIPGATVLNEGRRNIEKFGCYGCHKIKGWEHKRKPGPSLLKIAGKVNKEFFKNWVWDPKSFNKHAKMPAFFNQTNNNSEGFVKRNITEVNSIAEYVWSRSKKYTPHMKYSGGNKARGKKIIAEVGCLSCHGVEGLEGISKKIGAYAGPYLTGTGSKVSADWLVSWVKKPSHYQASSIMPSFRLSNKEANDITAYLMSLKNKKFSKLRFEGIDKGIRDTILTEYFSAFDTQKVAKARLDKMTDRARTLELGHRSIGKYGCYSCHDLKGFKGRSPIGPELTKLGSKPLTQFGFSHEKVPHERDAWITAHLLNPRRWDNGVDKSFKDLLRMPQFSMTKREARTITTALLGQLSDQVPLKGQALLSAHDGVALEGMKVVEKYNCQGCHQIDGMRGDILAHYEDDLNEGPPRLIDEGHRVQSDWFFDFLKNVKPIRPWLKVRMPTFNMSDKERNAIVEMFQNKSVQPTFVQVKKITWLPGERVGAIKLFKSLDCASCHTLGFNKEEPAAPDLRNVAKRLRPSWVKKWLKDPQAILEGTSMPSFWEDGESTDEDIFGGDPEKQINALTKYIIELGSK